jgi:hypothetical protein
MMFLSLNVKVLVLHQKSVTTGKCVTVTLDITHRFFFSSQKPSRIGTKINSTYPKPASLPDDVLRALCNLQFAEDARNRIAHRLQTDDQWLRNFGITLCSSPTRRDTFPFG